MSKYKISQYAVFSEPLINDSYTLVYSTSSTTLHALKTDVVNKISQLRFDDLDRLTMEELISNRILVESEEDELKTILDQK